MPPSHQILIGDCIESMRTLPDSSVQMCVTSPPYFWQRDYGVVGQMGQEETPEKFVSALVSVFAEVRRLLKDDGVIWLNLGDSYYSGNGQPTGSDPRSPSRDWMRTKVRPLDVPGLGYPKKSLLGIPWMVAKALQADGWTVRADVIWCRDTAFSEPSVKDRPYRQHEYLFLISKSRRYWFDRSALPEESVWHIPHERGVKGHSAAFPKELARRCILSGCPEGGVVLDPFGGAGTTAVVAMQEGRKSILCELNPEYAAMAERRIAAAWLDGAAQMDVFRDSPPAA
ncbi:DNA-methyltransferase [Pseudomonas lactis]|uniref:DNA-methyltransferase n=1 Tax=Pseudomonas lactis TaxID=1615674 RepID=UPI00289E8E8A|nr:site-specific DNA-methyltransferase [Pseudomonas lactis]